MDYIQDRADNINRACAVLDEALGHRKTRVPRRLHALSDVLFHEIYDLPSYHVFRSSEDEALVTMASSLRLISRLGGICSHIARLPRSVCRSRESCINL
jgi:hypothetical protein